MANPAQKHTCDVCGRVDIWSASWSRYGTLIDEDEGGQMVKTCSTKCERQGPSLYRPRTYRRKGSYSDIIYRSYKGHGPVVQF